MNTYNVDIVKNENIATLTYKMVINCPDSLLEEFVPGQFLHIKVSDNLKLRRPISINNFDDHTMTIIYKVLGEGTKILSEKKIHDRLDILGPIGRGFPSFSDSKTVFLLGGGLGCAPLLSVAKENSLGENYGFMGYGDKEAVYGEQDFNMYTEKTIITTDDGSYGVKGYSVDIMEKYMDTLVPDVIFACGPLPLMKKAQKIAKERNIPCYLSLEERMGCGYGACLTCVCKTIKDGKEHFDRVCVDGPVFDAMEVEL